MKNLPKVTALKRTCEACPSQWEGQLEDGRSLYIRYRWGHLSVCVSRHPSTDVGDAVDGIEIYETGVGGDLDGYLTFTRMRELTSVKLDFTGIIPE